MGWGAVWQLAWKQFHVESVEIQLAIGLALAFLVLMILVGLRYAFRPAGPHRSEPVIEPPRRRIAHPAATLAAMAKAPQPAPAPAQPFQARKSAPPAARKLVKPSVCAHAPMRPLIRRAGAAYSPLLPRR